MRCSKYGKRSKILSVSRSDVKEFVVGDENPYLDQIMISRYSYICHTNENTFNILKVNETNPPSAPYLNSSQEVPRDDCIDIFKIYQPYQGRSK